MTIENAGVVQQEHPWMETYLGIRFYPTNPRHEDINIEDIAHALSQQCRYAGHVKSFYSVAEHSVRVSQIVPSEHALWGLMHDAAEAYLQDMIRPLKCVHPLGDEYRKLEDELMLQIALKYGLSWPMPPEIKHADNVLLFTEQRDLRLKYLYWQDSEKYTPLPETIVPWSPDLAKYRFLKRFEELSMQRNFRSLDDVVNAFTLQNIPFKVIPANEAII
jgi:5'-deoxynucleotidase YfbR-like HD superfamily hydrolase